MKPLYSRRGDFCRLSRPFYMLPFSYLSYILTTLLSTLVADAEHVMRNGSLLDQRK
jgi:hypothetical protein